MHISSMYNLEPAKVLCQVSSYQVEGGASLKPANLVRGHTVGCKDGVYAAISVAYIDLNRIAWSQFIEIEKSKAIVLLNKSIISRIGKS